jgi:multidrug efflux system membrane fusion protein
LTVLAVGRDSTNILSRGQLAVLDNSIDPTTATIRLKATFPNDDLQLWPGQFVNARLLLTIRKAGLVVPASVIQRGPDQTYAFVIEGTKDDLKVKVQPVKVAQIEGNEALVDEGLRLGQRVVVDGQYRLQSGSKVRPRGTGSGPDAEAAP